MVTQKKRRTSSGSAAAAGLGVVETGLCLDFVNTEGVERNSPPDRLEDLDLFLDWAVSRNLTDASGAASLRRNVDSDRAGRAFLAVARELREALYGILSGLIEDREPSAVDVATLDRHLTRALAKLHLEPRSGGFDWRLPEPPQRLAELLLPIALSAADLLRSDRLDRLKECAGDTCAWVFIDESRNRSRRWCDMADCGNRAKARRFYRRHAGGN